MKKIVSIALTCIMLFAFSACDGVSKDAYRSSTATDISNEEIEQLIKEAEIAAAADTQNSAAVN